MKKGYVQISASDVTELQRFLDNLSSGKGSFRYFQKRPLTVISNHAVTLLHYINAEPVAYGHLDLEDDVCWLGVAVADDQIGKGYGKMMVVKLLKEASEREIKTVRLSVDDDNSKAIGLYEKIGFKQVKEGLVRHYEYNF